MVVKLQETYERLPFFKKKLLDRRDVSVHKPLTLNANTGMACVIDSHGYLPKSIPVDHGGYQTEVHLYQIGYSVNLPNKSIALTKYDLCMLFRDYINTIVNKIYNDAMQTVIASAFYKNAIVFKDDFASCVSGMVYKDTILDSSPGIRMNKITDLYVGNDLYVKLPNTDGVLYKSISDNQCHLTINAHQPNEIRCTCHRAPEIATGGDWYKMLTDPNDEGGFGMSLACRTVGPTKYGKHLMLGINQDCVNDTLLCVEQVGIFPDCHSQQFRFYGIMGVACATMNNGISQLGAIVR